jgi:NADH:ubiquinone reductase (non-electrogenic)
VKVPFGLCVWATGLGANPFTQRLQQKLGHAERRAVAVDKFLRVRGAEGIYALGDCSDVKEGTELVDSARELFDQADVDGSGTVAGAVQVECT